MPQSNSPPPSQPEEPTPADPQAFIEYSRTLYEWTSQKWLQALRESEERRTLLEQYQTSRNLWSQSQSQAQQTSPAPQQPVQASLTPQQPTQASSSAGAETTRDDNRTTQSPSNRSKSQ